MNPSVRRLLQTAIAISAALALGIAGSSTAVAGEDGFGWDKPPAEGAAPATPGR